MYVCVHLCVLTCCTECKHRQTAWWREKHTYTCIPVCSTYTRKCTLTNAHSCAHADAHTHTHAYTGYVVHNLCSVTWISLASVKAAARAHASTEHAAGKASSQCARQMTEDTWASTHVHKTAQIKANYYVPDSTPFPPFIFQTFLKLLGLLSA